MRPVSATGSVLTKEGELGEGQKKVKAKGQKVEVRPAYLKGGKAINGSEHKRLLKLERQQGKSFEQITNAERVVEIKGQISKASERWTRQDRE